MPFRSYKSISIVAKEYQIKYGIVSNGAVWQFGKLISDIFTQNKTFYTIQDLEKLFAAVNYVFQQCDLQLDN